jgi:hypothetical protein
MRTYIFQHVCSSSYFRAKYFVHDACCEGTLPFALGFQQALPAAENVCCSLVVEKLLQLEISEGETLTDKGTSFNNYANKSQAANCLWGKGMKKIRFQLTLHGFKWKTDQFGAARLVWFDVYYIMPERYEQVF